MYAEADLLPLSAIQHLAFCPRQCALIYLEGVWDENRLTVLGGLAHERAHEESAEFRDGVLIRHSLPLRSLRLGLSGIADVVEFHPVTTGGIALPGREGLWLPFPVEHKRGKPKPDHCDEVQVCAQALCLEEMTGAAIPRGALYYGEPRRRTPVEFTAELRAETEALAAALHELVRVGETPRATREPKCRSCSLVDLCLPAPVRRRRDAGAYLRQALQTSTDPDGGEAT